MATKKCPFCAEEIQAEAILCRYCHSRLDNFPAAPSVPAQPQIQPQPAPQFQVQPAPQPQPQPPLQPQSVPQEQPAASQTDSEGKLKAEILLDFATYSPKLSDEGMKNLEFVCSGINLYEPNQLIAEISNHFAEEKNKYVAAAGYNQKLLSKAEDNIATYMSADEKPLIFIDNDVVPTGKNGFMITDQRFYRLTPTQINKVEHKAVHSITCAQNGTCWYLNDSPDLLLDDAVLTPAYIGFLVSMVCLYSERYNGSGHKIAVKSDLRSARNGNTQDSGTDQIVLPEDTTCAELLFELKAKTLPEKGISTLKSIYGYVNNVGSGYTVEDIVEYLQKSVVSETKIATDKSNTALLNKILPRVTGLMAPDEKVIIYVDEGIVGTGKTGYMLTDKRFYAIEKKFVKSVALKEIETIHKQMSNTATWFFNEDMDIAVSSVGASDDLVALIVAVACLLCGKYNGVFDGSGFKIGVCNWFES